MNNLLKIAKNIGNAFKSSPYYDSAEKDMQLQWDGLIWPFIKKCNFANTIDLAAGHGRNAEMLKKISQAQEMSGTFF